MTQTGNHTDGIQVCVIFTRKPEFHYLATIRSKEDAKMYVQQRIAQLQQRVELTGHESPALQRWLTAEAMVATMPNEPDLLLPNGPE